jgi:hypothetical protein
MRGLFVFLILLFVFDPRESRAQQETVDERIYHLAAEYCHGTVPRPMALSSDRQILCFDGWVDDSLDLSLARDLANHGLFVVRSFGGSATTAIALAYVLRDRHATVVAYDYCLSACASYLFVASDQTYVLKHALVAWRSSVSGFDDCTSVETPRDEGPRKIKRIPCPDTSPANLAKHKAIMSAVNSFYSDRAVNPLFDPPPDSIYVRRTLINLYEETGVFPNVLWTLNPRHQATFKTKITYEAYPESQEEVDAMAARLQLGRVIYDP